MTDAIYSPNVDICEDSALIQLTADMPGVDQASANVTVKDGVLTIEGQAHLDEPQGYTLVGQEHGLGKYRRDFTLSKAINIEGIKARMQQGVLVVNIPKREEVKARRIMIEA